MGSDGGDESSDGEELHDSGMILCLVGSWLVVCSKSCKLADPLEGIRRVWKI